MLIFFNDAHKDKVCGYAGGYGAARIQIPKEIEPGVQFELMQSRCQLDLKPSVWQLQRTTEHKVPDQLIGHITRQEALETRTKEDRGGGLTAKDF